MARLLMVFLLCLPATAGTIYCTQHDFTASYPPVLWAGFNHHNSGSHFARQGGTLAHDSHTR